MKRSRWFGFKLVLALALGAGLAMVLLTIPGSSQAQLAGSGVHSVEAQSPIIDPPIDIWSDGYDNREPMVAYNSRHDEYLVVWYTRQDSYTYDIWAQRVHGDGGLETGFVVASSAGEERASPVVAYSPAQDQYLIAYTNFYTGGGFSCDVYATRISWDGSWTSGEFAIADAVDGQLLPAVAYNSRDDEYLVVYVNQWAGGLIDVYAQRVRAGDGQLIGQNTVASGMDADRQLVLAYGEGYGYLAVWHFEELSPPDTLYGRHVLAGQDAASGSQFPIASLSHTDSRPAVTCGPSGDCLVVYSWWDGGDDDIEGRFVRPHRVYVPVVLRNAP
jgi:hypothetical protein